MCVTKMRLFSKILRVILVIAVSFSPCLLWAAPDTSQSTGQGFGQVAMNLMVPLSLLSDFVHTACILIGASFIFAGTIKYFEHRRSPLMVPISTVVYLYIAGILLLLLPLVAYITENGIQYTLFT